MRAFYMLLLCFVYTCSYCQVKEVQLSHYIFPIFTKGVIMLSNGTVRESVLNYNSISQEMLFEENGKKLAIGKDELDLVDTVIIEGRKFVPLNNKFFELLYSSQDIDLYAEHICSVIPPGTPAPYGGTSYTSSVSTYTSLNTGGMIYDLQLPDGFTTKPRTYYWLNRDGILKQFFNTRQLLQRFNDKKKIFNAYTKKHKVKYDDQLSIVELIKYLEKEK